LACADESHNKILQWLVSTDPSPIHNKSCELHETHTGKWLTRYQEYQDWKSGSTRLLWIHGIPGAGKTVLASYIVEDIKRFCQTSAPSDAAWAYYYCYFGRQHDEAPHLLRWIINQLCRQSTYIPSQLIELYQQGGEPKTADLAKVLSMVLRRFQHVYVVLDALDESLNRQNLLDIIIQFASDHAFKKIKLLAMSRKEIDIESSFEELSISMSLSNPLVDEDIRIYVQRKLREDRKFRRWPVSLTANIERALVKGAKGMYVS
jgi:NACHT domain